MAISITSKNASGNTATVHGKATPGKRVKGTIGSNTYSIVADENGDWSVSFSNLPPGSVEIKAREYDKINIPKVTDMEISLARLKITGTSPQNTIHPTLSSNLYLENGAPVNDRIIVYEYRVFGNTEWIVDGSELSDISGNSTHVFQDVLEDGTYQFRVTAGTVASGFIEIISNTISVTTDKPNEAPQMPPSYTTWVDSEKNGKYGYLGYMYITQGAASGTSVGRVLALNSPKPAVTYSIDDVDFAIDASTGMITLVNSAKAAGTYYVTITASNIAGSQSTIVPITLVPTAGLTRTYFVDSVNGDDSLNNGKTPATPFKTFGKANGIRGADVFSTYITMYKRGTVYDTPTTTTGHALRNYTTIQAYGDPSQPPPHFITTVPSGFAIGASVSGTLTNVILKDLKITGTQRAISLTDGTGSTFLRLQIEKNSQYGNGIYLHGFVNSNIYHCTLVDGIDGDGMYLRKWRQGRVRWCKFGIPTGTGADNLQITSERKSGMEPADVEVSDNIFRHSVLSNALKGNCVIEGASRVLFERNDCEGNYFCLSSLSSLVTVRDNYLRGAILNDNSFGIGTGAIIHTRDQRWIFNRIEGNWFAMALSGYDDPDGGWQRMDYEILYNHTRKNKAFFKQDRPATGFVTDNIAEQNNNNGFSGSGGAATGYTNASGTFVTPDYPAFTKGPNFVNSVTTTDPVVKPTISGTMTAGSTLTVTVPEIAGATSVVQWLINDQKVLNETGLTFIIPAGQVVNPNMPTYRNTPTVSCAVVYTLSNGATVAVPARYDDGYCWRYIQS
ncbi:pectin lyase fold domain-containing protein [Rhizobium phage RHph_TM40]|uniref:Pectin lyase fold domain-containing protein n=1 Tax=Rhizobium phage RHph_TM30 TaxID=2509764 RepID=A0A7S5R5N3_9CAUD|nr:pectin lyase fold domain-containing protein [Rhizobium phage RHph_TM30]QIG71422.1 pectin lyase fold domain-containing protein [Rhizobium phage RHph_TM30]QIG71786.1 pectin lyase fold domain-containing protein [Rhizobium phage RHph_TM40]QIG72147.1 pectin lyase fold domain-containing protein [Rhizobium phage RHph_TM2_3B]QIG72509.1 pectin lyase fold domain-containing protein [Rhizobium phage RHph_TM3_3_6]